MPEAKSEFSLAAEFPTVTQKEWRELINAALKDASFDKRLVSQTYDGLRLEPLYARAVNAQAVSGREPGKTWTVVQRVDHPDPEQANAQILDDLKNGADGLALIFAGAPSARRYGVTIKNVDDLERALAGVMFNMISLRLETAPFAGRPVSTLMTDLIVKRKVDPATLIIDFGLDPIGDMARTGNAILPWAELSQRAGATAKDLREKGLSNARFLRADGRVVHDAGGTEAQELAFALATGVAYLRLLEANGFTLDEARQRLSFLVATDDDQFLIIAKFRALRKLWARVEQASGLVPQRAFVAAETAWRMMTRRDPCTNMLRTTIAVAAAGVAGADVIGVLPFTLAIGLPDRFARRVARNMQLIFLEESNLYRIADPAAGSGAIEAMTDEITQTAWKFFQEIEATGGAAAALEKGFIQKIIAQTRAARETNIAQRKDAITGVSDYPNLGELPVKIDDVAPVSIPSLPAQVTFEALPNIRLAETFEALRNSSDQFLTQTGNRPKVFLANLGTLSDFTSPATYAKNFYEAGGIEAVSNDGFQLPSPLPSRETSERRRPNGEVRTDLAAMVAAFKQSGAKLACLCSTDQIYKNEAAEAITALTDAGAVVHLAGSSGENEQKWRQAGVKAFIFSSCDALSILHGAHDSLSLRNYRQPQ